MLDAFIFDRVIKFKGCSGIVQYWKYNTIPVLWSSKIEHFILLKILSTAQVMTNA